MANVTCNYGAKASQQDIASALAEGVCAHCGMSQAELETLGASLDVCAEEFGSDLVTGERILTPIALCGPCHHAHHIDANGRHNPCQVTASYSREACFETTFSEQPFVR